MTADGRGELGRVGKFFVAGVAGFLIDALTLAALVEALQWAPWRARFVSFPTALVSIWLVNRLWVFPEAQNRPKPARQFAAYLGVQFSSFALNYGIFSGLIAIGAVAVFGRFGYLAALFGASCVSAVYTFLALRFVAMAPAAKPSEPSQ